MVIGQVCLCACAVWDRGVCCVGQIWGMFILLEMHFGFVFMDVWCPQAAGVAAVLAAQGDLDGAAVHGRAGRIFLNLKTQYVEMCMHVVRLSLCVSTSTHADGPSISPRMHGFKFKLFLISTYLFRTQTWTWPSCKQPFSSRVSS